MNNYWTNLKLSPSVCSLEAIPSSVAESDRRFMLNILDALMGMMITDLPGPGREELFNCIQEWRVCGEVQYSEEWLICKPVGDQSSPMETNIVPYDDISGLLWSLNISEHVM